MAEYRRDSRPTRGREVITGNTLLRNRCGGDNGMDFQGMNQEIRNEQQENFGSGTRGMVGGRRSYRDAVVQKVNPKERNKPTKVSNEEEDKGKYEKTRVVYGDQDDELVAELRRSLVGETLYPIDMEEKLRKEVPLIEKLERWVHTRC